MGGESGEIADTRQSQVDIVTMETQRLDLGSEGHFHPADNDYDTFSAEDIQGASSSNRESITGARVPNVETLTNLPQHLSEDIFKKSVMNFEQNVNQGGEEAYTESESGYRESSVINYYNEGNNADDSENKIRSSGPKPLNTLHDLSEEPDTSESRVLLAIKLPDGKRIQRYFRQSEELRMILHFVENTSLTDYSDYWLVCNAPKLTFVDLSQRIGDTPIQDRTVLYLEEKD